jgi:type I restriction enzyme, S subunit
MASNYKKLGKYIQQVKDRNKDLKVENLQGVSIFKEYMPSVANVIGTDMSKYRIVKKNQFAYNPMHVGRDEVLPISLFQKDKEVIVSPAYTVFEIINTNELNPEYLMMWFRRREFDRKAWFTTDNSIRGSFSWEDMCDMELPVPDIEIQKEIVDEYNAIINRIKNNNQLIQKCEETAQTIYKNWFVDFEFPNEKGKPYKSTGGKLEYDEELDLEIPIGWESINLNNIASFFSGYSYSSPELVSSSTAMISIKNFDKNGGFKHKGLKEIVISKNIKEEQYASTGEILIAHTDLTQAGIIIGAPIMVVEDAIHDKLIYSMDIVKAKPTIKEINNEFLYFLLKDNRFKEHALTNVSGTTVLHLSKNTLPDYKLAFPLKKELIMPLCEKLNKCISIVKVLKLEINQLSNLKEVLLSKMSQIELIGVKQ